jgi:NADH:ubiquinone oxidoreductase subunit F (NADH-binding)
MTDASPSEYPKLLTSRYGVPESWTLRVAEMHGAYSVARKALTTIKPEQIQAEVKDASIRGRGGAGFRCRRRSSRRWRKRAPAMNGRAARRLVLTAINERPHSALRVALNMNNTALVQRAGDGHTGLAIRIAERIRRA